MRWTKPKTRILITKMDLEAAYRRLYVTEKMALLTITIICDIAYIFLRLPFGVANSPADCSAMSEPVMDLTNDILQDETWDPDHTHNPIKDELDHHQERYEDNIPYGQARELFVEIPYFPADADGYIYDIITLMLENNDWVEKAKMHRH